jgi:hypothetical protein
MIRDAGGRVLPWPTRQKSEEIAKPDDIAGDFAARDSSNCFPSMMNLGTPEP